MCFGGHVNVGGSRSSLSSLTQNLMVFYSWHNSSGVKKSFYYLKLKFSKTMSPGVDRKGAGLRHSISQGCCVDGMFVVITDKL